MRLEEANKMSLQEMLDYSVSKLVQQGKRCVRQMRPNSINTRCAYGFGDIHCAIGWLLDEDDEELMNFTSGILGLIIEHPKKIPHQFHVNHLILLEFQEFHDERFADFKLHQMDILEKLGIDVKTNPDWGKWAKISFARGE